MEIGHYYSYYTKFSVNELKMFWRKKSSMF